jgi:TorA maturation chaperone TorD
MTPSTSSSQNDARALTYRLLSTAFLYPKDLDWKLFSDSFQSLMEDATSDLALDLSDELQSLRQCWVWHPNDVFLHIYTELFVNSPRGILAPLNESVYFGDKQLVNTERTQQVAQTYQEAGFVPAQQYRHLLADHLSLELEFMALSLLQGWESRDFFSAHVYSWQPRAAERIIQARVSSFYSEMARLLSRFLASENRLFGG